MQIDYTINLGTLVAIAGFVLMFMRLSSSNKKAVQDAAAVMARIELRLDTIWNWWVEHQRTK